MRKRRRFKSRDRISALPDELLLSILSLLSLKEAAATSLLGRRWRHLWNFTDKLDFNDLDFFRRVWSLSEHSEEFYDGSKFLHRMSKVSANLELESWNYTAWVDNVLQSHKGHRIEEFRVNFFLSESHSDHIDRWLRFASARNVERLDLNLKWIFCHFRDRYTLSHHLLMDCKQLRTLSMIFVNVSGEGLEFILRSCPLLEELSVSYSIDLFELKIMDPSLPLKRLRINNCQPLTSLEIRDSNLEYLMFHGKPVELVLENVPGLVEMHLGGGILKSLQDFIPLFSGYLPQLEKLTFNTSWRGFLDMEAARMFYINVEMSNLRQLTIKFKGRRITSFNLMPLTYFVRASPLLQSFVIEAYGDEDKTMNGYFVGRLPQPSTEMFEGRPRYPHLKRVDFIGYRGSSRELELVVHFLENGAALEEVNIDLRKRDNPWLLYSYIWPNSVTGAFHEGYPFSFSDEDIASAAKARVMDLLKKMMPSKDIRLNIL